MPPGFRRLLVGRTLSFLATALVPTALTLAVIRATGDAGDLGVILAGADPPAPAAARRRGARRPFPRPAGGVRRRPRTGARPVRHRRRAAVRQRRHRHPGRPVGDHRRGRRVRHAHRVAAGTLGGLRIAPRAASGDKPSFVSELAAGWREIRVRPWFWSNLVGHGVSNLAAGMLMTLGPLIAVTRLGGEISWVMIYQAGMAGLVLGALLAPRLRFGRPLVLTSVCGALFALPLLTFAVPASTWANAAAYGVAMLGVGVLNTVWLTVMQRYFPPHALARADSYDALLSFAARPLGLALAAPLAAVTGEAAPLLVTAGLVVVVNLGIIAFPDVRAISAKSDIAPANPDEAKQ